jgi:hypothetical protein
VLFSQVISIDNTNICSRLLTRSYTDSEKSTTKKMGDNTRSGADSARNDGKGIIQSAQETASSVAGAAADNLKAASKHSFFKVPGTTC